MTGIVRRINLLTALALLLSGLLQPLAAAQGVTCTRTHAPSHQAPQPAGSTIDGFEGDSGGTRILSSPHAHESMPHPEAASASAGPCGVSAFVSEQRLPLPAATARPVLYGADLPPASPHLQSLFRPPRLS